AFCRHRPLIIRPPPGLGFRFKAPPLGTWSSFGFLAMTLGFLGSSARLLDSALPALCFDTPSVMFYLPSSPSHPPFRTLKFIFAQARVVLGALSWRVPTSGLQQTHQF